ncbi:nuclear transport factor 2 family protein [Streptomyces sp. SID3343]|uniref:nuclear transport factor 2 family protein n=1 Tax=Streptomyces sp. SID3343 TaxID=2690260 RepID=UPI001370F1D4|nr:nuclear transport factor 2 family protein [Streptomyces sp. SID3343]MYW03200.1 nuclear transport factor 2 family protein [Streptomyces sp. SID3343]
MNEADAPAQRAHNVRIAERLLAAVSAGDRAAQVACYAPDVVLEFPYATPPVRVEGKGAVDAYLEVALTAFELRLTVIRVHQCLDPDTVIVEFTSEGRARTTGRPYANTYIAVLTFRDGLVVGQREFYNPGPAAQALTATPAS